MLKFSMYVLGLYALYYLVVIGMEYLKTPDSKQQNTSTSFSVIGAEDDEPIVIDDLELGYDAAGAVKKKTN